MEEMKCYDTVTKQYTIIEVTEEIAQFIRRSYWKEDMQERRYQKRKVLFDENNDYLGAEDIVLESLIKKLETEVVRREIMKLSVRDRKIIYYIYYEELTLSKTAELTGLSTSYMSRLVIKIYSKLKNSLKEIE